jgi:hypothetical protein
MSIRMCRHIKEDGVFCQNPALRDRDYCYAHLRMLGRRMRMAQEAASRKPLRLVLPPLEDLSSVQSALMQVLDAIASGQLEQRRAGLLLYGLQQAGSNLRHLHAAQLAAAQQEVAADTASQPEAEERVQEYPGFEAEFQLESGLDLSQLPPPASPPTEEEPAEFRISPFRRDPHSYMYRVGPEDVELEELRLKKGEEAYQKRLRQLDGAAARDFSKYVKRVERAHYVAEADRRNKMLLFWTEENEREFQDRVKADLARTAPKKPPANSAPENAEQVNPNTTAG